MTAEVLRAAPRPRRTERLLIVSHVPHFAHEGRWYAYGPYAREVELWAASFARVAIAAPVRREAPPGDAIPLDATNVVVEPQPETGGTTLRAKAVQLALLPRSVWALARSMSRADAIHVRCPGSLGLLGAALGPLFTTRLVAKYAGQWTAAPGDRWTIRLQRALLRSRWWRGPVLVYGDASGEPDHVVPFFTSALDAAQMARARSAAARRRPDGPLRLLFVGRLSSQKNAGVVIETVARLRRMHVDVTATIVGDGPDRPRLTSLVRSLGVEERVALVGALPHDRVLEHYESADVGVLLSETEGWPKAISEAMAFGLVCIGADCGVVRTLLGDGRGLVAEARDAAALGELVRPIAAAPERYDEMRRRASRWAQQYTREAFQAALLDVLDRHWRAPSAGALEVARV